MAHAFQIDTLAFSKRLRAAGADEKLAEAIVEGITGADISELATKADIAEVRSDLKWMRLIGAGILVTLVWQIVQQSFGL